MTSCSMSSSTPAASSCRIRRFAIPASRSRSCGHAWSSVSVRLATTSPSHRIPFRPAMAEEQWKITKAAADIGSAGYCAKPRHRRQSGSIEPPG